MASPNNTVNSPAGGVFAVREGLLDASLVLLSALKTTEPVRRDARARKFVQEHTINLDTALAHRPAPTDFSIVASIGQGHFGSVEVVRQRSTGQVYAMKTLDKMETLRQTCACYKEERDIMAAAESPWLTRLHYALSDAKHLYLVMDYHPGGDLFHLLEAHDDIFDEKMARFYLAELALALRAVHAMGYVHRDVKPDNVLLDATGHVKLADFGSSGRLGPDDRVRGGAVGTPDYVAPEVLASVESIDVGGVGGVGGVAADTTTLRTYGTECDWWSLGVVAFEMLCGYTPFSDDSACVTYARIANHAKQLAFPDDVPVSETARAFITALITEAEVRLNFEGIADHAFMEGLVTEEIRARKPPFVPLLTGAEDTQHFGEVEVTSRQQRSAMASLRGKSNTNSGFDTTLLPFIGFTFVREACQEEVAMGTTEKATASALTTTTANDTAVRLHAADQEATALRATCAELGVERDAAVAEADRLRTIVGRARDANNGLQAGLQIVMEDGINKTAEVSRARAQTRRTSAMAEHSVSIMEAQRAQMAEELTKLRVEVETAKTEIEAARAEAAAEKRARIEAESACEDEAEAAAEAARSLRRALRETEEARAEAADLACSCERKEAAVAHWREQYEATKGSVKVAERSHEADTAPAKADAIEGTEATKTISKLEQQLATARAAVTAAECEQGRLSSALAAAETRAEAAIAGRQRLYTLHEDYKQCHETLAADTKRIQSMRLAALERFGREVVEERTRVDNFALQASASAAQNEKLNLRASAAEIQITELAGRLEEALAQQARLQANATAATERASRNANERVEIAARLREQAETVRFLREENMRLTTVNEQQKKLLAHLQSSNSGSGFSGNSHSGRHHGSSGGTRRGAGAFNVVSRKLRSRARHPAPVTTTPVAECTFCPALKRQLGEVTWRLRNSELTVQRLEVENDAREKNFNVGESTGPTATAGRRAVLGAVDTNVSCTSKSSAVNKLVGKQSDDSVGSPILSGGGRNNSSSSSGNAPTSASTAILATSPSVDAITEGWVKMLDERRGSSAHPWVSVYMRLAGNILHLNADSKPDAKVLGELDLVAASQGKLRLISSLPDAVVSDTRIAATDVEFAFMVDAAPLCQPRESLTLLASSAAEKAGWLAALSALQRTFTGKAMCARYDPLPVLSVTGDDGLGLTALLPLRPQLALAGRNDGIYVLCIDGNDTNGKSSSLSHVLSTPLVTQIAQLEPLGLAVFAAGSEHALHFARADALVAAARAGRAAALPNDDSGLCTVVPNTQGVFMFACGTVGGRSFVYASRQGGMCLLEWCEDTANFALAIEACAPTFQDRCGCMEFLPALGLFAWGSSNLHLLNPLTRDTWAWLRERDPETMFYTIGGATGVVFPMAVFAVTRDEYLLCFNQGALFVDATGTVTRPRNTVEPWRRTPTAFCVMDERLFLFSLGTVEVRDLRANRNINRVQTLTQPGASFLASSPTRVYLVCDTPGQATLYGLDSVATADESIMSALSFIANTPCDAVADIIEDEATTTTAVVEDSRLSLLPESVQADVAEVQDAFRFMDESVFVHACE